MCVDICENVSHVGNQDLPLERLFYCYQGHKRDLSLVELSSLKSDCGMGNSMGLVEIANRNNTLGRVYDCEWNMFYET